MSSEELTEWQAYYSIEPFGEIRADLRSGILASMTYNMNKSKGAAPKDAKDFVLETKSFEEQKPPSPQTMAKAAELMAEMAGGDIIKHR